MAEQIMLIFNISTKNPSPTSGQLLNIIGPDSVRAQWQADPDGFIDWLKANGWQINPAPLPLIFERYYVIWYKA